MLLETREHNLLYDSRNAQAIRSTVISEKNGLRWPAVCCGKIRRFRQNRWRMLSGIMMKNIL